MTLAARLRPDDDVDRLRLAAHMNLRLLDRRADGGFDIVGKAAPEPPAAPVHRQTRPAACSATSSRVTTSTATMKPRR